MSVTLVHPAKAVGQEMPFSGDTRVAASNIALDVETKRGDLGVGTLVLSKFAVHVLGHSPKWLGKFLRYARHIFLFFRL